MQPQPTTDSHCGWTDERGPARFFGNMKNGIRGTYHSVSSKWLPSYLNEYAWRYNERSNTTRSMFGLLLDKAAQG